MDEKSLAGKMLAALAAAQRNPSLRMNRNEVTMGRDICVPVDREGNIIGDGVDPKDPKTWPCAVMFFGSAMAIASNRAKGKEGFERMIPSFGSRFYAWNPLLNPSIIRLTPVGEGASRDIFLVKVAEREIPPWDDTF